MPASGSAYAVAAGHRLAAETAAEVLADGGSSIDATIAGSAVQCVVEMPWCGLGGDAFAIIRDATGTVSALNGSGAAPRAIGEAITHGRVPRFGPLSVGVPGLVDAWFELHERYGRVPVDRLFAPAVALARHGVTDERLDGALARVALIEGGERLAGLELTDRGLVQRELADTLALLGQEGRRAFYEGDIATSIVDHLQAHGGTMAPSDLAAHRSQWCEPIALRYRDARVLTQPPVSMGLLLLVALKLLDRHCPEPSTAVDTDLVELMVRIKRFLFDSLLPRLGDGHPTNLAALDDSVYDEFTASPPGLALVPTGTDTTTLAVTGSDGITISFIHSLFNEFGSRERVAATGIVLNDRLANLAVAPGQPNALAGGRRPMHTLHSYLVERADGSVLAGATPGGRGQVQTNLQVLVGILARGDDLQQAIDHPRWVHGMARQSTADDTLYLEPQLAPLADALARRGQPVRIVHESEGDQFGSCTLVADLGDRKVAAADWRRSACTAVS